MSVGFRQSQASLHTWSGLIVGWVLYAMFLAGTVSFWREEITRWAQPEIGVRQPARIDVAHAQRYLAIHAAHAAEWIIALPDERAAGVTVAFRDKGTPRSAMMAPIYLDAHGEPVDVRATEGGDFFYRLHFDMHYMPILWGRWLAGLCAMAMLIAIVSGVITHKKIFADFFTFRPRKGQRSWLDGHNALAVLALPFHLMITYTGLVTLMTLYMPWGADGSNGSRNALFAEIIPTYATPAAVGVPTPLIDLRLALDAAGEAWNGGHVATLRITQPGDASARIVAERAGSDRISSNQVTVQLDGSTGVVIASSKLESAGVLTRGGMIGVHAGRFAPLEMRWLYFLLGVAGTAMVATGLVLWTVKRRALLPDPSRPHVGFRLVERLNVAFVAGMPLAMSAFLWANRLLPHAMHERAAWEIHTMFIVWAVALLHVCFVAPRKGWIIQFALAGVSLVTLALGDVAFVRVDFMWFDVVMALFGVACLAIAWGVGRHTPAPRRRREHA
nr:PepSY-associated TM helix domain-containing protein [Luteibacter rhizovicinus]